MSQPLTAHTPGQPDVLIVGLSPEAAEALTGKVDEFAAAQTALAEFVSMACATLETVDKNPDLEIWIQTQTAEWVGEHARQALYVIGIICQMTECDAEMVAHIGRMLLGVE